MIDPHAIRGGWDGADPDTAQYLGFHFCEGSSPSGKTHVLAWDGHHWILPCETLTQRRPATYTKPLCKICQTRTALLAPLPIRKPGVF